jgi:hypothetical protein
MTSFGEGLKAFERVARRQHVKEVSFDFCSKEEQRTQLLPRLLNDMQACNNNNNFCNKSHNDFCVFQVGISYY